MCHVASRPAASAPHRLPGRASTPIAVAAQVFPTLRTSNSTATPQAHPVQKLLGPPVKSLRGARQTGLGKVTCGEGRSIFMLNFKHVMQMLLGSPELASESRYLLAWRVGAWAAFGVRVQPIPAPEASHGVRAIPLQQLTLEAALVSHRREGTGLLLVGEVVISRVEKAAPVVVLKAAIVGKPDKRMHAPHAQLGSSVIDTLAITDSEGTCLHCSAGKQDYHPVHARIPTWS